MAARITDLVGARADDIAQTAGDLGGAGLESALTQPLPEAAGQPALEPTGEAAQTAPRAAAGGEGDALVVVVVIGGVASLAAVIGTGVAPRGGIELRPPRHTGQMERGPARNVVPDLAAPVRGEPVDRHVQAAGLQVEVQPGAMRRVKERRRRERQCQRIVVGTFKGELASPVRELERQGHALVLDDPVVRGRERTHQLAGLPAGEAVHAGLTVVGERQHDGGVDKSQPDLVSLRRPHVALERRLHHGEAGKRTDVDLTRTGRGRAVERERPERGDRDRRVQAREKSAGKPGVGLRAGLEEGRRVVSGQVPECCDVAAHGRCQSSLLRTPRRTSSHDGMVG